MARSFVTTRTPVSFQLQSRTQLFISTRNPPSNPILRLIKPSSHSRDCLLSPKRPITQRHLPPRATQTRGENGEHDISKPREADQRLHIYVPKVGLGCGVRVCVCVWGGFNLEGGLDSSSSSHSLQYRTHTHIIHMLLLGPPRVIFRGVLCVLCGVSSYSV